MIIVKNYTPTKKYPLYIYAQCTCIQLHEDSRLCDGFIAAFSGGRLEIQLCILLKFRKPAHEGERNWRLTGAFKLYGCIQYSVTHVNTVTHTIYVGTLLVIMCRFSSATTYNG